MTVYYNAANAFNFNKISELKKQMLKYDNVTSPTILPDGTLVIHYIDDAELARLKKGAIRYNNPAVAGIPLTYAEGERVSTLDGRIGTVLGSNWLENLVLYRYQIEPQIGFFVVKVDFGESIEFHIRQDLLGDRFVKI